MNIQITKTIHKMVRNLKDDLKVFFQTPCVALSINDTDNDDHIQLDTKCFQLSIL